MSYLDRVKSAKKADAEKRTPFKTPDGDYLTKFKGAVLGKSRNGDDMFTLDFAVRKVVKLDDEKLDKDDVLDAIKEKREGKIKVKRLTKIDFQFNHVLELLADSGMDITTCDESDKKHKKIVALLDELSDLSPEVTINLYTNDKGNQNPKFVAIEKVGKFDYDADGELDDEEEEEAKPAPKKKAPTPAVEDDEDEDPTYEELRATGWNDKQIAKHYPHLIED